MRGILFGLSFVSSIVAILGSIDAVGAMDGTHITFSWAWWAVSLAFLQLMPARAIAEPIMPIEVSAIQLEGTDDFHLVFAEIDVATDVLTEFFVEPAIETRTVVALPTVSMRTKCQAARIKGQTFENRRRYPTLTAATTANGWLPPSLGLKA